MMEGVFYNLAFLRIGKLPNEHRRSYVTLYAAEKDAKLHFGFGSQRV
jgi:hypothetical protein